jgi:hypothetical protein
LFAIFGSPDNWKQKHKHHHSKTNDPAASANSNKNNFMNGLSKLWGYLKTVFGYAYRAMKVVVGKITLNLWSIGQKIAYFIMTNPRQARLMIASVKLMRTRTCRWLDQKLLHNLETLKQVEIKAQTITARFSEQLRDLPNHIVKMGSVIAAEVQDLVSDTVGFFVNVNDPISVLSTFVSAENVDKTIEYSTSFMGSFARSIPFAGGILGVGADLLGSMITDAVKESVVDVLEAIAYQNEVVNCISLLISIVDVGEIMTELPNLKRTAPNLYELLKFIRYYTRLLSKNLLGTDDTIKDKKMNTDETALSMSRKLELEAEQSEINEHETSTALFNFTDLFQARKAKAAAKNDQILKPSLT